YARSEDLPLYRSLASGGALADRYFQPVAGASSANDMYLWTARFAFLDNEAAPAAIGAQCGRGLRSDARSFKMPNLGELLSADKVSWAWYGEGYAAMAAAGKGCPSPPSDCAIKLPAPLNPCTYSPGDIPPAFFKATADDPAHMRDFGRLAKDLAGGTLPA